MYTFTYFKGEKMICIKERGGAVGLTLVFFHFFLENKNRFEKLTFLKSQSYQKL